MAAPLLHSAASGLARQGVCDRASPARQLQASTSQPQSREGCIRRPHTCQARGQALQTRVTLFGFDIGNSQQKRTEAKQKLLETISTLKRGAEASDEDKARVEEVVQVLERNNPNPQALASPLLNGKWELLYTTSATVVGSSKPAFLRPAGPIYQWIDAPNGRGMNSETTPFFNSVTAELTPTSKSRVDVQFKQFKILGLLPVTAPESAKGWLDTTYLDEELRISRGDKGNLFVLTMNDREARP